jgi:hypothetical protein
MKTDDPRYDSTDGITPGLEDGPAPGPINPATGQHTSYWVLSPEERAKGFQRPVRLTYKHVGRPGPSYPLRDLTPEEQETHTGCGYVKYETFPESESPRLGRYWRASDLEAVGRGCGVVTRMAPSIAETYARQPAFYGSTFCVGCGAHFRVGVVGEFVWEGTDERVGT